MQRVLRDREYDVDEWTLRARREKKVAKDITNTMWNLDQMDQWDLNAISVNDLNDKRMMAKQCVPISAWSAL